MHKENAAFKLLTPPAPTPPPISSLLPPLPPTRITESQTVNFKEYTRFFRKAVFKTFFA